MRKNPINVLMCPFRCMLLSPSDHLCKIIPEAREIKMSNLFTKWFFSCMYICVAWLPHLDDLLFQHFISLLFFCWGLEQLYKSFNTETTHTK